MPTVLTVTIKPSGGDYSSYADFVSNYPAHGEPAKSALVSSDTQLDVAMYAMSDNPSSIPNLTGWTTDATHYLRFYTPLAERHTGKRGTGYRLHTQTPGDAIQISSPNVRFEGISFVTEDGNYWARGFWFDSAINYGNIVIRDCFYGSDGNGSVVYAPFITTGPTGGNFYLINNLFTNETGNPNGTGIYLHGGSNYNVYAYNNSLLGWGANPSFTMTFEVDSLTGVVVLAKNNLVDALGFLGATNGSYRGSRMDSSSTNNLSVDDSTCPGSNPYNLTPVSYVNISTPNYRLSSSDTGAKGHGADLSGDANFPFAVDLEGNARSAPWAIGAYNAAAQAYTLMGQACL